MRKGLYEIDIGLGSEKEDNILVGYIDLNGDSQ